MSTSTQLITAEQLLQMPKEETRRCELIEGVLTKMSPAGAEHGDISITLGSLLWQHVRATRLGKVFAAETGFKVASNPDTVLAPDAAFIRQEEFDRLGPTKKFWPGAPDLAVEVMSPDDSVRQTDEKARGWLSFGARMVWVVNPAKKNRLAVSPRRGRARVRRRRRARRSRRGVGLSLPPLRAFHLGAFR